MTPNVVAAPPERLEPAPTLEPSSNENYEIGVIYTGE